MSILSSNKVINEVYEGIKGFSKQAYDEGITKAWRDNYQTKRYLTDKDGKPLMKEGTNEQDFTYDTKWGKVAGHSMAAGITASAGYGAIKGAVTNDNEKFDLPGIPFI